MSNSLWPVDYSLPGSSVHGIFQARILEWVAISFSIDRKGQNYIHTHKKISWKSNRTLYFPLQEAQVQSLTGERRYHKVWGVAEKESVSNERDPGSTPGSGRFSWEGNGNPLQYSCLENTMDRRAWWSKSMGSQRVGHNWATNTATLIDI